MTDLGLAFDLLEEWVDGVGVIERRHGAMRVFFQRLTVKGTKLHGTEMRWKEGLTKLCCRG